MTQDSNLAQFGIVDTSVDIMTPCFMLVSAQWAGTVMKRAHFVVGRGYGRSRSRQCTERKHGSWVHFGR